MDNLTNDSNFNWKYLCYNTDKIFKETDILISRSKVARDLILKLDARDKGECSKIISTLADDTFEFNNFHSLSKLLKLVSPNKCSRDAWGHTDKLLNFYIERFNTDIEIFKKIREIPPENLNSGPDQVFINKILKCFFKYGLTNDLSSEPTIRKLHAEITILEDKISKILHMKNFQQNRCIQDIFNLVKMRNQYAKSLKCDSYATFKSDIDIVSLQKTLKNLITSSHQACYNDLQKISSQLTVNRVSILDIINYTTRANNQYKVSLECALSYVFGIIKENFCLQFTKLPNIPTWHDTVEVYLIKYANEVYGYMYIDLLARQGKSPNILSIALNEAIIYPYESGILRVPVTALLGNLPSTITYLDVINIFRELGSIIHTVFHRSKYGITLEQNMKSVIPHLFECIARDIDNIKKLFEGDYIGVNGAITSDRAFKLKYKCINTLFDYLLHGTEMGFQDINLVSKYNAIAKSVLNKSVDQYMMPTSIPIDVIVQVVYNGGTVYSDITNSVMAFNLYSHLKERGTFNEFIDTVLRECSMPLKSAIASFMNNKHEKNSNDGLNNNNPNSQNSQNSLNSNLNKDIRKPADTGYNESLSDNDDDKSLTDHQTHKHMSDNTNYFTEA
jgi:hypothetical protein